MSKNMTTINGLDIFRAYNFSAAKKIAALAHENGIKLMWGCFDESKVSISAALHTALSCENTQYIDLDGFFDLGWDLIDGGYKCENGIMSVLDKSGLGVY